MTRGSPRSLVRRARADADVHEAIDHYLEESTGAALGFVDALELAYEQIRRSPAMGSPRYGHELNLQGLRCWPCRRYPYLVFYVAFDDRIEVWRVLHMSRDIPHRLREGASPAAPE